jgi:hypothetical protein
MRRLRKSVGCLFFLLAAISLAGAGCGSSTTTPPQQPIARTPLSKELPLNVPCPLGVEDATAYAEDVPGAIEVTLTSMTKTEELRMRVASAAKAYGPMRHRGPGHDGRHGLGHQHGLQLIWLNRVSIVYEEIPAGARLRITPNESDELAKVRATVHEHVLDIASRPCKPPGLPVAERAQRN